MTPQEVLEFATQNDARQLDLRFTDIPSLQHHVSYPISELDEGSFEEGFGMDGSSIRGWAAIHESDMLLIPDPERRTAARPAVHRYSEPAAPRLVPDQRTRRGQLRRRLRHGQIGRASCRERA